MPGSLSVTAPMPGTQYAATETGFLLEGATLPETYSVWVNGYRLRLYEPGKTFWNYKVSTEIGTLKRGENVYRIVARNSKGEILDTLEYTVTFKPGRK
jgi:hypothetical protein